MNIYQSVVSRVKKNIVINWEFKFYKIINALLQ